MTDTAVVSEKDRQRSKSVSVKDTVRKNLKLIITGLFWAAVSFMLANGTLPGGSSPSAMALLCAVPNTYTAFCALGSGLAYFTIVKDVVTLKYIGAIIIASVIKNAFTLLKTRKKYLAGGVSLFVSLFVSSALTCFIMNTFQSEGLIYCVELIVAEGMFIVFRNTFFAIDKLHSFKKLGGAEAMFIISGAIIILSLLQYLEILSFSPARMVITFIILAVGCGIGENTALFSGAVSALCVSIAVQNPYYAFVYLLIGICTLVTAQKFRFLGAIATPIGALIAMFIWGSDNISYISALEVGAGAAAYMLIPKDILEKLSFFTAVKLAGDDLKTLKSMVSGKLHFAAGVLGDVSRDISLNRSPNSHITDDGMPAVYKSAMLKTCDGCGLKSFCWDTQKEYTITIFSKIGKMLCTGKELEKENLPNDFGNRCIRPNAMIKNLNTAFAAHIYSDIMSRRLSEARGIIAGEFETVGEMLSDLADTVEDREFADKSLTYECSAVFEVYGIRASEIVCTKNISGRVRISAFLDGSDISLLDSMFIKSLEKATFSVLEGPYLTHSPHKVMVTFYEKSVYSTETGFCQINARGNTACGDAFEIFKDGDGRVALLVADGMGKGELAGIDGVLAADTMKKLISAGFSPNGSLRITNCALMVKSDDESFSTVDMAAIDLFSGKVSFYKAGAACSFIRRKGKAGRVELASMPVGILKQVSFASTSVTLSSGDMVLVVSDGVTAQGYEWVLEELKNYNGESATAFATKIANKASVISSEKHSDDITVLCGILK